MAEFKWHEDISFKYVQKNGKDVLACVNKKGDILIDELDAAPALDENGFGIARKIVTNNLVGFVHKYALVNSEGFAVSKFYIRIERRSAEIYETSEGLINAVTGVILPYSKSENMTRLIDVYDNFYIYSYDTSQSQSISRWLGAITSKGITLISHTNKEFKKEKDIMKALEEKYGFERPGKLKNIDLI